MPRESNPHGPDWYAVRLTWNEVQQAHKVSVLCETTLVKPDAGQWHLWYRLSARTIRPGAPIEVLAYVGGRYPQNGCASLPALLYRMLLDLDHKLTQERILG